MRKLALFGWLVVPLLAGAYHYGPGQDRLRLDDVARTLALADQQAEAGRYEAAIGSYDQALAKLPAGHLAETRQIRVERARAQMLNHQLPEANADLTALVEEMQADKASDPAVLAGARAAHASSQYYLTWLMKLEGLPREDWEPDIEGARQTYRMLAEDAEQAGDQPTAGKRREDLESAIRLARMDPGDLQGKPLPKQCQGCKSGQCKKPGRKPGAKEKTKDARGASSGPPPDGSGS
jgi:tetratricopeptide (TPR) repeat protein